MKKIDPICFFVDYLFEDDRARNKVNCWLTLFFAFNVMM